MNCSDSSLTRRAWVRRVLLAAGFGPLAAAEDPTAARPPITALAFSPDGKFLVAASQENVLLLDPQTIELVDTFAVGMDQIHDLDFDTRGRVLAVAGGDPGEGGVVEFVGWPQRRRTSVPVGGDVVPGIAFSPSGDAWVAASMDEAGYAGATGRAATVAYGQHSAAGLAACFLPDGETVVTAGRDQTLRVWNAATGESIRTLHNHTGDVFSLALRPAAPGLPLVASASADRTVRLWQPTIGRMVRFARVESIPLDLAWSSDGRRLFAACQDGAVREIDPERVVVVETHPVSRSPLFSVAASPGGRFVVVGGVDGRVEKIEFAA